AKLLQHKGKVKPMRKTVRKPVRKARPSGAPVSRTASRQQQAHKTRPAARAVRKAERPAEKTSPRAVPQVVLLPKWVSKQFAAAVHAYEMGIKLMYAEDYAKAIQKFNDLITHYPDEPEIQASAKARIQACENKLQERARTIFRSADDHYNI